MLSFVFLLVLLAAVVTSVQGKCDAGCLTPVAPYEEMGCKPVFAKPDDCCPTHYNCASIEGRSIDKCYYQGNVYKKGETVPLELTSPYCLADCLCNGNSPVRKFDSNPEIQNDTVLTIFTIQVKEFTCVHIDCPEFFGGGNLLKPGCYRGYELNKCCSTKNVCPPFDNVAKCEVNGKTYYDGQRWKDADNKLSCVCGPNFKGKLEEPFCRKSSCGTELIYSNNVRNRCAPVFYGTNGKCPIQWNCYSEGEKVIRNPKGITSEQKCHYGNEQLNIGDKLLLKLSPGSPKIDCECRIPPLVTCIQQPHES